MGYLKTPQRKKRRGAYLRCETCGDEFYIYQSQVKKAQARGHKVRYCSMKCYAKDGENNPFHGKKHREDSILKMSEHPNRPKFKAGPDNPNFVRYGEEYGFKGSRFLWWRRKLIRDIGKCERCGFDDLRLLTLHHMDRNRAHNTRENLRLWCWNCHALHHFEEGTGAYHFRVLNGDKKREQAPAGSSS